MGRQARTIKQEAFDLAKKELAEKTAAEKRFTDLGLALSGANQNLDQERGRRQILEERAGAAERQAGESRKAVVGVLVVVGLVVAWWLWVA